MDDRDADRDEDRRAWNEVLFREVNESIEQQALRFGGSDSYEFLCECSSVDCVERVALTLRQYERIRAEGTRFVVVPGHADLAIEQIVGSTAELHVVEKDGAAGIIAEQEDPRSAETPAEFELEA